jgi:disulfide bond formation protein DsbB
MFFSRASNIFLGIWVVALVATLGSLFFSEVMSFVPCSLCWYQRICMYPLLLLSSAAVFSPDNKSDKFLILKTYFLPITVIGWLLALYHNLIHWGIIPETMSPCRQGVPCSTVYINWLGFITIPFLSFIAFTFILGLIVLFIQQVKKGKENG